MNIKTEIQKLVKEAIAEQFMRPTKQQEYRLVANNLDDVIGRLHGLQNTVRDTPEAKSIGRWIATLQDMRDIANKLGKYEEDL